MGPPRGPRRVARGLPDLPGYQRVKGDPRRRVETPDGHLISRRHYEDLRFKAAGWRSYRDYQNEMLDDSYVRWLSNAIVNGKGTERELRSSTSEFNRKFLATRRAKFDRTKRGRSPKGPFADFLIYTGDRDEGDTHDVGDSPGKGRRRR